MLDVDVEKERISLGIKQLGGDPLQGDTFRKGQTVTVTVTEITSGGIEVKFGDDEAPMTAFIRKSDLSRDRAEQRPERFAVGDRMDAQITNIDKAARRVSLSVKALEMAEEKEAIEQFGSSDSGASLGDILGAALSQGPEAHGRHGRRRGIGSRGQPHGGPRHVTISPARVTPAPLRFLSLAAWLAAPVLLSQVPGRARGSGEGTAMPMARSSIRAPRTSSKRTTPVASTRRNQASAAARLPASNSAMPA